MKAFVFAAGFGTRMRPLNEELAKPAMPFYGRPIIAHTLEWLAHNEVNTAIINLHHQANSVRDAVTAHTPEGFDVIFSSESDILGTGGGLIHAQKHFGADDGILAVNGDTYTDMPLKPLLAHHKDKLPVATLVLNRNPTNKALFGVGVRENGTITDFWGEPDDNPKCIEHRAFLGVYVVTRQLLELLSSNTPEGGFGCVKENGFIPALSSNLTLESQLTDTNWFDLGTPERYLNGHIKMIEHAGKLSGLPQRRPYVWSQDRLPRGAVIEPPVVIGSGLQVGKGCTIGPAAFLGKNVQVKDRTTIRRSVVWDDATVDSTTSDCIISTRKKVSSLSL